MEYGTYVCQKCSGKYFTWHTYTNTTFCEDCS